MCFWCCECSLSHWSISFGAISHLWGNLPITSALNAWWYFNAVLISFVWCNSKARASWAGPLPAYPHRKPVGECDQSFRDGFRGSAWPSGVKTGDPPVSSRYPQYVPGVERVIAFPPFSRVVLESLQISRVLGVVLRQFGKQSLIWQLYRGFYGRSGALVLRPD